MGISDLCLPVKIYLVLTLIGLIYNIMSARSYTLWELLFDGVYAFVIHMACKSGYVKASWLLLFLQMIVIVFLLSFLGLAVAMGATPEPMEKKP
jgi:hypothetical protein